MRLASFRIQNFRSIKDTGWHSLATDNIACLIGQNESGKSSVLEALNCFYTGRITPDDLRNDGSLPQIACSFTLNAEQIKDIFALTAFPPGFLEGFQEIGQERVNLLRSWSDGTESVISLEETDLASLFNVNLTASEASNIFTADEFAESIFEEIPQFAFFEDFANLLPDRIDDQDIQSDNTTAEGFMGAKNLFTLVGIDASILQSSDRRIRGNAIADSNKSLTIDFQEFWQQKIGKSNKIGIEFDLEHHDASIAAKAGQPYYAFWVNDGKEKLYPKQRSKGVRWFLSFYLQLMASKRASGSRGIILLIDEPGGSLHAKAQEDLLKVLEDIKDTIQVIYTTHSPHLVSLETLYRVLAVQRADADDDESNTQIIGIHKLGSASVDTLTPIYTLMGADASHQNVICRTGNIILEEISAYYYLRAFTKLIDRPLEGIHFLPATGNSNVPLLCNLFLGWGLGFGVMLDGDRSGKDIFKRLCETLFGNDEAVARQYIHVMHEFDGIEDMFSLPDFKKHILNDEALTYSGKNSAYVKSKAKAILALGFMHGVENGSVQLSDLEQTSQDNIAALIAAIEQLRFGPL